MGYDYSNLQVFAGDRDSLALKRSIIDRISNVLPNRVDKEDAASRSIVIGNCDRWIFVGDTAGSTEDGDFQAFKELAVELSKIAPLFSVEMSDSAIVHFCLYANGKLVDKFGNGLFPFFLFKSEQEAKPYKGKIENWLSFLTSPDRIEQLRKTWSQEDYATNIVANTAKLFDINPELMQVGYSIFDEAEEIKYSKWLEDENIDLKSFEELHFAFYI